MYWLTGSLKGHSFFDTYSKSNHPVMLRSYFTVAFRNLRRHKAFSFLNIVGLSVGMAVALLNGLWVWDELTFNQYHRNYHRIAQVTERGMGEEGKRYSQTALPYPLGNELKTTYGRHFKHVVVARRAEAYVLTAGEVKLSRKGMFMEAAAPEMFSLKMLKGTWAGLKDPHSVMLSASTARALFGEKDPLHEPVRINTEMDAIVTGVYEDLPRNTAFHEVQFLGPFDLWAMANPWAKEKKWDNSFLEIYAQLAPQADFKQVSALIKDLEMNQIKHLVGRQEQVALQVARQLQISLLPMSKWHLEGGQDPDDQAALRMVWLVGLIGGFVLLLACINFMNLSTARSEKRAKEVGIRKTIGSLRSQLVGQFLGESLLMALLAFSLALWLTTLALPWFNALAAKQMPMPWNVPYFWLLGFAFVLLTGLIAGSYPAFYLSSFQPVQVLKGTFRVGRLAALPRKVLVVLQFTVSITLMISTLVVYRQIEHAKNRPVGYSREGLLLMEKHTADFNGKYEVLRRELKNTGVVLEMAESKSSVTRMRGYNGGFTWNGQSLDRLQNPATQKVTAEYGKTVGWQFVAGRDFSRDLSSDSSGIVINESFASRFGQKNPVGEVITWAPGGQPAKVYTVLGVVKDMVIFSPYEPTMPIIYFVQGDGSANWINIRLDPKVSAARALPKIEAVFRKIIPSVPFDYQFADQQYALKFAAEERIGKLAGCVASLAIFISCLGLFGLASFFAEQRTKEMGIRKVLGASVYNLWQLLSKDFIYLVLLSLLISGPLAWYLLNNWLQQYTYRTEISGWIFALSGTAALVISLLTVSFQTIKAALANPVKSLRTE